ncbi:uncharacterized protein LOC110456235 [Mizuhopecten yessoensis]|uniref:C-type lectin domain-containing protein n=1 Tax=Mizuhopecten yessoensis TaxID=6573 RepID=A0A210QBH1_MIZYE|nr:uncharacterized protein LOC110456235 [Mizuhopecten yessoensis]OWF46080.1 hypothetical protein KP79_PYT03748 [Mizuhopecten yessoensis]
MDALLIVTNVFLIQLVVAIEVLGTTRRSYKLVKESRTWSEARKFCEAQGGDLGVVTDFYSSPGRYLAHALESTPDLKAWVAGKGQDDGWDWYDQQRHQAGLITPLSKLIAYRGCVKPEFIMGGLRMHNNNAEGCFRKCKWKGSIALKSWYCICEWRLRNITVTVDDYCDITCPGRDGDRCGGIHGVSLYQMNPRAVLWGEGEPLSARGCVYINRPYEDKPWSWHASHCHMIRRFLCRYDDHHICGVYPSCVRPSTKPATWEDAVDHCHLNNGTIATVDVTHMHESDDIISIPPGQFWVGLSKQESWKWTNGITIPTTYFHANRYDKCTSDTCVVLQKKGDLKLAGDSCDNRRPFICQFYTEHHSPVKDPPFDQNDDPSVGVKGQGENTTTSYPDVEAREEMYKTVMYLAIGVASGMALVFSICIIAYVARRCRQRSKWKARGGFRHRRVNSNGGFVSEPMRSTTSASHTQETEILYDIPCDPSQSSESPFRRTQRALRQESLRETPYTHTRRGSDGYRSLSWKRVPSGSKKEKEAKPRERQFIQPEIRSVYTGPATERFHDASYMIHQVQAQCHDDRQVPRSEYMDIETTARQRTRRFSDLENDDAIRLADTYSQPGQTRRPSDNGAVLSMDTSDLYACVNKVMSNLNDDRFQGISN